MKLFLAIRQPASDKNVIMQWHVITIYPIL